MITREDFTRINNDVNGNPRYVIHFLNILTDEERKNYDISISDKYAIALKRAKKIHGRKFHNKQFGGGIVFQSYNIEEDLRRLTDEI